MRIVYTKHDLERELNEVKSNHQTIGFVPTMGALHQGHVSLIQHSKQNTDYTVCSIFVNPTQFNDKNDLARYPRTPEADIQILEEAGCDLLFMPSVDEIYPKEDTRRFDFGYLDKILDGAHRPGHFNGVGQVVSIFFDLIQPTQAFFGQKDYQQVMIIKKLVEILKFNIEIVPCPILREPDGLAMSSRNILLNTEERHVASMIPKLMLKAKDLYHLKGIDAAKEYIYKEVSLIPIMKMDYFVVCDQKTLEELNDNSENAIGLIAVFVDKIRLIDNLFF